MRGLGIILLALCLLTPLAAAELGEEAHVVINNKAEGSAPLSAVELAREIRRQAGG